MLEPIEPSTVMYREVRILATERYPNNWEDCQSCRTSVETWSIAWYIEEGEGELYGPFCDVVCAKNKVDQLVGSN